MSHKQHECVNNKKESKKNTNNMPGGVVGDKLFVQSTQRLEEAGVAPAQAKQLAATKDAGLIAEAVAWVREQRAKNPPGLLYEALRHPEDYGFREDGSGWHRPKTKVNKHEDRFTEHRYRGP